jgi:primosomal protein N''
MSLEEDTATDTTTVTGHVVAAKRKYRRAKDEERELNELIKARNSRDGAAPEAESDSSENLDAEESTFKKRYGDLRRHMQNVQSEHRKELKKLESKLNELSGKKLVLPKTEAEMAEFAKKYPDVSNMMKSIALKESKKTSDDMKKEMEDLQELRRNVIRDKAESELLELHPDYDRIRKDPTFHEWAAIQPKWVQDSLYENEDDAVACAKALTLYKAEVKASSRGSNSSEAARKVRTKSGVKVSTDASSNKKFSESQVQAMSASEYDKNEEAITASIKNNTFVYDISGAAR